MNHPCPLRACAEGGCRRPAEKLLPRHQRNSNGVKRVVGKVMEGSRAEQAGFRVGDELLRIDGKEVLSWDHRRLYLFRRALDRAVVRIEVRDAQSSLRERILDLANFPAEEVGAGLMELGIGLFGYQPQALPEIGALEPGPAMRAGLEIGDRIVEVDARPVRTWEELVAGTKSTCGGKYYITPEEVRHFAREPERYR